MRMTEGIRIGTPYCICPPAQCTDLYGIGTRGRGRCAELSYYHVSVNCGASLVLLGLLIFLGRLPIFTSSIPRKDAPGGRQLQVS